MSAAECHLKKVDVEQAQGLWTCIRALRASPVAFVQVETGEQLLAMRRFKVLLAYCVYLEGYSNLHPPQGYLGGRTVGSTEIKHARKKSSVLTCPQDKNFHEACPACLESHDRRAWTSVRICCLLRRSTLERRVKFNVEILGSATVAQQAQLFFLLWGPSCICVRRQGDSDWWKLGWPRGACGRLGEDEPVPSDSVSQS